MATRWFAEERLQALRIGRRSSQGSFALAAACLAAVLIATAGWTGWMRQEQQLREREATAAAEWTTGAQTAGRSLGPHPGAANVAFGGELADVPYLPGPLEVREDRARDLYPGCHQNQQDSEPILCYLGPDDPARTIAVVGGSRAEHWLPALEVLAEEHGWRIVAVTKSGCLFTGRPQYESCTEWNGRVIGELERLNPDAVFTTSTRVPRDKEIIPRGYVERWQLLDRMGIPILAIRDVPRPLNDVPDCVEAHGPQSVNCGADAALYGLDRPAAVAELPEVSDNVSFLDLTEYFCVNGFCPAVIGNVLVYHDNSHITATYARTLAPFLGEAILEAIAG